MRKANTFFQQVPVSLAKQIAAREAGPPRPRLVACVICGAAVELEHCKIDESGSAVHEKCYVGKLSASVPLTAQRSRPTS
jgi:hypothetical protein